MQPLYFNLCMLYLGPCYPQGRQHADAVTLSIKGRRVFTFQGLPHSPLVLRRLPGLPSFALQGATLQLLTAMLWSTLPGFLCVGSMLARRGGSVLGGSCTAFLVSLSCGSRVAELAAATVSATQGAFVRPCIVRCPLPMIIPPLIIARR